MLNHNDVYAEYPLQKTKRYISMNKTNQRIGFLFTNVASRDADAALI
jgi:hypothetical protein